MKRNIFSPWFFFIFFFGFIIWKLFEYHCFPDLRVISEARKLYWGSTSIKGGRGVVQDCKDNYLVSSVPAPSFFIDPEYWSPSDAPALEGLVPEDVFKKISGSLKRRYFSLAQEVSPEDAEKIRSLNLRGLNEDKSAPAVSFYIDPEYWSPSDASALEGLVPEDVLKKISGSLKSRYFSLLRRASPEVAEKIRALKINAVHEERDLRREYHNGRLLSHVLGFCDVDGNGQAGIELAWDSTLYTPNGYKVIIRKPGGRSIVMGDDGTYGEQSHIPTVKLTIDARIQYIVEKYLNEAASEYKAKWGAAICINPNTGAVLSMASWPVFDPNKREELVNLNSIVNNAVGRVYEPGSTFKPIYMGIALEEGLVRADETFNCPATIKIADGAISEAYPRAMGRISTAELLIKSSNVGMAQIGMKSKPLDMYRTLLDWGFGKASDIELKGTEKGILASPGLWRGVIPANISIGQGLAVTPLHLIAGMAAVVNGGKLLSPYIVQEVTDARGDVVYRGKRNVIRDVLTDETSAWLRKVMRDTVLLGTGRKADTSVTEIAAKTGTAQIAEKGKYVKGRYVSSIIGFWPYSSPQYLMLLVIGEPTGEIYFGGELAAPAFKKIVDGMADLEIFDPLRRETL